MINFKVKRKKLYIRSIEYVFTLLGVMPHCLDPESKFKKIIGETFDGKNWEEAAAKLKK